MEDENLENRLEELKKFQIHLWEIKQWQLSSEADDKEFARTKDIVLRNKLWIGNEDSARHCIDIDAIVSIGSKMDRFLTHTDKQYFRIIAEDSKESDLKQYFHVVCDFIHKHNKVLVHCVAGVSRSATICIAYLIKYGHLDFYQAYMVLKTARPIICPNYGFIKQLLEFEKEMINNN